MAANIARLVYQIKRRNLLPWMLAAGALVVALGINVVVLDATLLKEGEPRFGLVYLLHSLLIALSAWLITAAFMVRERINSIYASTGWDTLPLRLKQTIVWITIGPALLFLGIFLSNPALFYMLASEDQAVENISVMFNFLTMGIFISAAFVVWQRSKLLMALNLGMAVVFFVLGMEEISWFQRVFDIKPEGIFQQNIQKETNLHNFATNQVELLFYFLAFVGFVMVPFINDNTDWFQKRPLLAFFTPGRFLIFTGALFVTFNYDMWNILFTQLAFFTTLFVLIYYLNAHNRQGLCVLSALVPFYILAQVLFLEFGNHMVRQWDLTEYKELLIALTCLAYSFEIWSRSRHMRTMAG